MKRSIRRHQQRVAAVRRVRILLVHGAWPPLHRGQPKIWKRPFLMNLLNEPGWWVHEYVVVPARILTHRLEHEVTRGRNPDGVVWPDFRKPHRYYW